MAGHKPAISILLVDSEQGRWLADALTEHGVDATALESSEALHQHLMSARVEVLVLQQQLNGFLQGLEIVQRLATDLIHPEVVLLGELSPVQHDAAKRLKIGTIIPDSADVQQLLEAALSSVAQISTKHSVIPQRARQLAGRADVVRPLPQLLTILCTCMRDETGSLSELADHLAVDPRVTAELLKIANSTTSGLVKKVTGVHDAIKMLGLRRTIATVLASGILKSQEDLLRTLPAEIREWYQKRMVLIASTASQFAERVEGLSGETAHTLGLFQDLGMLVLANAESRGYLPLVQRVRSIGQARLEGLERDTFGFTHADVSAALLEKWDVPQSFVAMVLDHHSPERNREHSDVECRFLHVMRVAEAVANMGDLASPYRQRALESLLAGYGPKKAGDCRTCITLGVNKTVECSKVFSIPQPDEATLQRLVREVQEGRPSDDLEPACSEVSPSPTGEEPDSDRPLDRRQTTAPCSQTGAKRILVVDDEQSILKMMSRMLRNSGYDIVTCHTAAEAEKFTHDVDLIFCDMHLGGTRGVDLVNHWRERGIAVPVIMMSGDRTRDTVMECIQAGIADYVVKPFTRDMLLEKLRQHLATRISDVVESTAS